mmetsp:Transcript_11528/g.22662  ORF Transcript_11528/g.22662 Transcript_11528/m.22662 type:complete len:200 (+) Transcript_11528:943-1542(+)
MPRTTAWSSCLTWRARTPAPRAPPCRGSAGDTRTSSRAEERERAKRRTTATRSRGSRCPGSRSRASRTRRASSRCTARTSPSTCCRSTMPKSTGPSSRSTSSRCCGPAAWGRPMARRRRRPRTWTYRDFSRSGATRPSLLRRARSRTKGGSTGRKNTQGWGSPTRSAGWSTRTKTTPSRPPTRSTSPSPSRCTPTTWRK